MNNQLLLVCFFCLWATQGICQEAEPLKFPKVGDIVFEKQAKTYNRKSGQDAKYQVGTLYVKENRSEPDSRVIGVGFAIHRARNPVGPPVFFLPGGPGGSYLERGWPYLTEFLWDSCDVICVDQRGYSRQGGSFLENIDFDPGKFAPDAGLAEEVSEYVRYAKQVAEHYSETDVDLRGYTILECADDVNELRAALGYNKITLRGQSFGSQWSFAIMKRHPEIVERAMLTGVEPLNNGFDMPSHVLAAVQRTWKVIDQDPEFKPYLPPGGMAEAAEIGIKRLESGLVKVFEKEGDTEPVRILGPDDFYLRNPQAILDLYHEKYKGWARPRTPRIASRTLLGPLIDSSNATTPERHEQLWNDPAIRYTSRSNFAQYMATADIWPSPDIGDEFRTPEKCDIPVVFVNGDWDMSTPIENMYEISPFFPNSRQVVVHQAGHSTMVPKLGEQHPELVQQLVNYLITGEMKGLPESVKVEGFVKFPPPRFELDEKKTVKPNSTRNRITHGPILGKPGATTMSVWARTHRPGTILVEARKVDGSGEAVLGEAETVLAQDNTGVVKLENLDPDSRYEYRVNIKGDSGGPSGTFKTWMTAEQTRDAEHNPDGLFNFRFEFACGNSQSSGPSDAETVKQATFETLNRDHAHKLDFAILNGDWLYERERDFSIDEWKKQTGVEKLPANLELVPRIVGIWQNYKSYLERGKSMANFHRHVPSLFTMDDHEILNDIAGSGQAGFKERRAVLRDVGAQAWIDYLAWSNPMDFKPNTHFSRASFEKGSDVLTDTTTDFTKLPINQMSNLHVHWGGEKFSTRLRPNEEYPGLPNAGVYDIKEVIGKHQLRISPAAEATSKNSVYSIGRRLYGQFKVSNCHFFLIDTRSHRDVPDFENPERKDRSMLGAAQLKWLNDGIAASDAEFIFVVSSVNFMIPHSAPNSRPGDIPKKGEAWTVFMHEREQLLEIWDKMDKQVFLLTGDLHNSFAIQISDNVWEFASGPHESYNHHIGSEGHRPINGRFQYGPRECDILWSSYLLPDTPRALRRRSHFCVVQVNNVVNNAVEIGKDRWIAFPRPQVVFQYYDGNTGDLVFAHTVQSNRSRK